MWKYDPESLITGAEVAAGMTYENSRRDWASKQAYEAAANGEYTPELIAIIAPRTKEII